MPDPLATAADPVLPTPREALIQVKNALIPQSERTPKGPARDAIDNRIDAVNDLIDACTRSDIADTTVNLNAAADPFLKQLADVDALAASIASIAANIQTAAEVLTKVDALLSGIKSYLGVL